MRRLEKHSKNSKMHEVLPNSLKWKAYDDELGREELLNYFCSFQSALPKGSQNDNDHSGTRDGFQEWGDYCCSYRLLSSQGGHPKYPRLIDCLSCIHDSNSVYAA